MTTKPAASCGLPARKEYLCCRKFKKLSMKYSHLTQEQRYAISVLLQGPEPMSMAEIARRIGVSRSTVWREIKRNSDMRGRHHYNPELAQRKADARMKRRRHYVEFTDAMKRDVRRRIVYKEYSPEQIAGRFRLEGKEMVSHETIYKWVWRKKRGGNREMAEHLRHRGRHYCKRGSEYKSRGIIKGRVGIERRPAVVDEKRRFGDFEIDTVIGRNHKGAVMTINDRCTHIVLIRKLKGKEAGPLAEAAVEALSPYKPMLHTITGDNGKEFAGHKDIASALGIDFYFARPYHSWERGANENTNGLIRQYIPKGTDLDDVSEEYIREIEWKLNNRPRKSLGYLTPLEYFEKLYNFDLGSVALSS